jgi:hypothetical protein
VIWLVNDLPGFHSFFSNPEVAGESVNPDQFLEVRDAFVCLLVRPVPRLTISSH